MAAEKGNVEAQYRLGRLYSMGDHVAHDYKEAAKCFRQATIQGHSLSQYELGMLYKKGLGVSQDYMEATRWLKQSIAQDI